MGISTEEQWQWRRLWVTPGSSPSTSLLHHPALYLYTPIQGRQRLLNWAGRGNILTCSGLGCAAGRHFDCQQPHRHSPPHADFHPAWNRCTVGRWAPFLLTYYSYEGGGWVGGHRTERGYNISGRKVWEEVVLMKQWVEWHTYSISKPNQYNCIYL